MELELETKVFNQGSEMHLNSTKNVGKKLVIFRNSTMKESDKKLWTKGERWVIATKFNLE